MAQVSSWSNSYVPNPKFLPLERPYCLRVVFPPCSAHIYSPQFPSVPPTQTTGQFSIMHFSAIKQQERDCVSKTDRGMKGCKTFLEPDSYWERQGPGDFSMSSRKFCLVQMQIVTVTYLNWFSRPLPRINNHKKLSLQIFSAFSKFTHFLIQKGGIKNFLESIFQK